MCGIVIFNWFCVVLFDIVVGFFVNGCVVLVVVFFFVCVGLCCDCFIF